MSSPIRGIHYMNSVKYFLYIELQPLNIYISKNSENMFLFYGNNSFVWRHTYYIPKKDTFRIEINSEIFEYLLKLNYHKVQDLRYFSSVSQILKKLEIYDLVCESLI